MPKAQENRKQKKKAMPHAIMVVNDLIDKDQIKDPELLKILPRIALTLDKKSDNPITISQLRVHVAKGNEHLTSLYSSFKSAAVSKRNAGKERNYNEVRSELDNVSNEIEQAVRDSDFNKLSKFYRRYGQTVFKDALVTKFNKIYFEEKRYDDLFRMWEVFSQNFVDYSSQVRWRYFDMVSDDRTSFLDAAKKYYASDEGADGVLYKHLQSYLFRQSLFLNKGSEYTIQLLDRIDEINVSEVIHGYLNGALKISEDEDIDFAQAATEFNKNNFETFFKIVNDFIDITQSPEWYKEPNSFDLLQFAFLTGNFRHLESVVLAHNIILADKEKETDFKAFNGFLGYGVILGRNYSGFPKEIMQNALNSLGSKTQVADAYLLKISEAYEQDKENTQNYIDNFKVKEINNEVFKFMLRHAKFSDLGESFDKDVDVVVNAFKLHGFSDGVIENYTNDPTFIDEVTAKVREQFIKKILSFLNKADQLKACHENPNIDFKFLKKHTFMNILVEANIADTQEFFSWKNDQGESVFIDYVDEDFVKDFIAEVTKHRCLLLVQDSEKIKILADMIDGSNQLSDKVKQSNHDYMQTSIIQNLFERAKLRNEFPDPEDEATTCENTIEKIAEDNSKQDLWLKVTGKKAPEFLAEFASPYRFKEDVYNFVLNIFFDEHDRAKIPGKTFDQMRKSLAKQAYFVSALFDTNQDVLEYMERHARPTQCPLKDCTENIIVPLERFAQDGQTIDIKSWSDAVMQGGAKMAKLTKFIDKLSKPVRNSANTRWSYEETKKQASLIAFERASECPELAQTFIEFDYAQDDFEHTLDLVNLVKEKKKLDFLPDITIEGEKFGMDGARFCKLDPGDVRGLFLGDYTNNCQSVFSDGRKVALNGFCSSYSGFYIVEKNEEIIGVSWAWLGKEGKLVFDSLEQLGGRVERHHWEAIMEEVIKQIPDYNKKDFINRFPHEGGVSRYNDGIESFADLEQVENFPVAIVNCINAASFVMPIDAVYIGQGGGTYPFNYPKTTDEIIGLNAVAYDAKEQYKVWEDRTKKAKGASLIP